MVARLLGTSRCPRISCASSWEKAEGNPLFVEEITTALREGGLLRPGAGSFAGARTLWVSSRTPAGHHQRAS